MRIQLIFITYLLEFDIYSITLISYYYNFK